MCESNSGPAVICDRSDSTRSRSRGWTRLSNSSSSYALLVPRVLHVDADGGCGVVRGPRQSVRYKQGKIYDWLLSR